MRRTLKTRTSGLTRLAEVLPEGVAVTILADRGFGDTKLFDFLDTLGFASHESPHFFGDSYRPNFIDKS